MYRYTYYMIIIKYDKFPKPSIMLSPDDQKFVYILQLEHHKWYVGKTKSLTKRYEEHKTGQGCEWTKIHRVIKLEKSMMTDDDFQEDLWTKKYMQLYGIDNVRGGSYCQVLLHAEQIHFLEIELRSASNSCLNCGVLGHFASVCPQKQTTPEKPEPENIIPNDTQRREMKLDINSLFFISLIVDGFTVELKDSFMAMGATYDGLERIWVVPLSKRDELEALCKKEEKLNVEIHVTGKNTYPLKDKLKAIGGKYDGKKKLWIFPKSKLTELETITL